MSLIFNVAEGLERSLQVSRWLDSLDGPTTISVFTGYWFYRKARPLKRITYDIMSDTPVVSIGRQVGKGKIKIEYEDNSGRTEEIGDARLLTLKV